MPFPYPLPAELGGTQGATMAQLLPPGAVWSLEPDSLLTQVLIATGNEFDRVRARGVNLIDESDPRTATETLSDWEAMLGLPDSVVTTIPATVVGRRRAIIQKFIGVGGQTAAYYVALAAACGYTVTISDTYGSGILRSGFRCGARCYSTAWAYVWSVTVYPPVAEAFELTHDQLEGAIRRAAPAHTNVFFIYL